MQVSHQHQHQHQHGGIDLTSAPQWLHDRSSGAIDPEPTITRLLRSPPGSLTVGLVQQCQTIHGRDRNCIPPQLPPEWITTLFFILLGVLSLTVTCVLMVMSRWRREAARYARWIAFTGSRCPAVTFSNAEWQARSLLSCQRRTITCAINKPSLNNKKEQQPLISWLEMIFWVLPVINEPPPARFVSSEKLLAV